MVSDQNRVVSAPRRDKSLHHTSITGPCVVKMPTVETQLWFSCCWRKALFVCGFLLIANRKFYS